MRTLVLMSAGLLMAGTLWLGFVETTGWLLEMAVFSLPLILAGPVLLGVALLIAFLPGHSKPCS
ncbi:hypothetical protein [Thermochromatium tepidum]|uniref:Uncharacterized protein n=1 Tax=Thermochromatium tepidum ATCC 43061 TaxID=316276 RepID=A0A6I6EDT0_THETI|nr:hypothetical protein [Thermochromatium tepidum]QGU31577.1 hypothetical protein E6P07_00350 [Thermochromatium tepidum ATCC 43061]